MLLCSIADIRGRTTTSIEDDALGALIEAISDTIEDYVGAWLAPRPADPSLTATYLFDIERTGSSQRLMSDGKRAPVRTLSALGVATYNQPAAGGVYSTIPLANALLRRGSLVLTTGSFYRGFNTVTATGSFGPASVSSQVREATIQLVTLTLNYDPGLSSQSIGDWSETSSGGSYIQERNSILATIAYGFPT